MLGNFDGASTIDHCEGKYVMTSSIAEPLGCAGSAFVVLAGLWLTHIGKRYEVGNEFEACFISIIIAGISGMMFHAGLTLFYQRLYEGTELFMIIYIGMKLTGPRQLLVPALLVGMVAFLYLISETSFDQVHFASNFLFLTLVLYRCLTVPPCEVTLHNVLWRSSVIYALAMLVQHVDRNMCAEVKSLPIPGFWAALSYCWHAMQAYCYLSTVICALYERLTSVASQRLSYKLMDEEIPYLVENTSSDCIVEPVEPVSPKRPVLPTPPQPLVTPVELPKPQVIPAELPKPPVRPPVQPVQPLVPTVIAPELPLVKPPVEPPVEPIQPLVKPPVLPTIMQPVEPVPEPQSAEDWNFESPSKPVQPKQRVFSGKLGTWDLAPPSPEEFSLDIQMRPVPVQPEDMSLDCQVRPAPVTPEESFLDFQARPIPVNSEPMTPAADVKKAGDWDFGSASTSVRLVEAESRPSNGSWTCADFSAAPQTLVGRDKEASFTEQGSFSPTSQWKRKINEVGSEAQQPLTKRSGAYQGRYSLG